MEVVGCSVCVELGRLESGKEISIYRPGASYWQPR